MPLGACGFKSRLRHWCDVAEFLGQTNPQRLIVPPGLVVLARIEREMSNELDVSGDDANVEIGHQNDDSLSRVTSSQADVVHRAPIAKRHATAHSFSIAWNEVTMSCSGSERTR